MAREKPKPRTKPKPTIPVIAKTIRKKDYTSYWLIAGLIFTLIVYLPSLTNGLTNWDDTEYLNNPYVKNLSLAGVVKIFSVYFSGNYHPFTLLSLGIDYLIGGNSPFMFHFTNLLFHLLNTFFVFLLVKRLTKNNLLAALTFILFGVHTLHVESVAWITERKDVLYSFFYLLSLIVYTTYASNRKGIYYGLSLLFFIFSLLAKGQAVVLAAILPFIDYLMGRKWFSIKVLSEKLPFLFLMLFFGWIAFRAQELGIAFNIPHVSFPERFALVSFGLTQYLIKSILPIGLSAFYPYPQLINGSIPSFYWLFIILLPVYFTGSYFLFKHSKIYAFGLSMFFLNLLPVLQLIPVGSAIMADRYFYIPSIGLMLCFASGFLEIKNIKFRYALFITFVLILSCLSFLRCMVWKDSITLWDDVISKYNYAQIAYYNRGTAYGNLVQWDKAIADYSKAIEIDPHYSPTIVTDRSFNICLMAYVNRGAAYGDIGQQKKAIIDFNKAIEIDPKYATAYYNRGFVNFTFRHWDQAIADYSKAIEIDPNFKVAYNDRGDTYCELQQWDNAIADYSKAIEIDTKNVIAYSNRGNWYTKLSQWDKASIDFSKAVEMDPKNSVDYYYLGNCYLNLQKWNQAIVNYSKVIEIDPNNSHAYSNRGIAYGSLGQFEKALNDFSKAIEIDPNNTNAYSNREMTYKKLQSKE
jgi:tetratricopeptide (TPR) repeat protein